MDPFILTCFIKLFEQIHAGLAGDLLLDLVLAHIYAHHALFGENDVSGSHRTAGDLIDPHLFPLNLDMVSDGSPDDLMDYAEGMEDRAFALMDFLVFLDYF